MPKTLHRRVTVERGGRIIIDSSDLPEGAQADVTVSLHAGRAVQSYRALFGSGSGGFATAEEADAFLRKERDAWDD